MADYKITFCGDKSIGEMHHVGIEYNGNYYSVIFGKYINGGFFAMPVWNACGELGTFDDVLSSGQALLTAGGAYTASKVATAFKEYKVKQCEITRKDMYFYHRAGKLLEKNVR